MGMSRLPKKQVWISDSVLRSHLPSELKTSLSESNGVDFLNALTSASLLSSCTDRLFALYEPLTAEFTARWTSRQLPNAYANNVNILTCLSRIFPFARYLRQRITAFLQHGGLKFQLPVEKAFENIDKDLATETLLLALFRLLSTDPEWFSHIVQPTFLIAFLHHSSLVARYLTVQCLCIVMRCADAFTTNLIKQYCGEAPIRGQWEGQEIDYHLLRTFEEKRWRELQIHIEHTRIDRLNGSSAAEWDQAILDSLSPETASVASILVPRDGPLEIQHTTWVSTSTASRNLQALGHALLLPKPVLLTGKSGAGKTATVLEAARLLNKRTHMLTLYLNEQTDAKSLLGIYTSSANGDSFSWQPGVLTKAIEQGRWVLIEDIDRAPAEVRGLLQPVLERGELFLPNKKEIMRPAEGFRIFATLQVSRQDSRLSASRHSWLADDRIWNVVQVAESSSEEVSYLVSSRFPVLEPLLPNILAAHHAICEMYQQDPAFRAVQGRLPSTRDLLKWCRRICKYLSSHDPDHNRDGSVPESAILSAFKDGVDCFAALHNDHQIQRKIAACIAHVFNISPQQRDHILAARDHILIETKQTVRIDRSLLRKLQERRQSHAKKSRFAMTGMAVQSINAIAASVANAEPLLLVGETGVGKTTVIQYVAELVNQKLIVVNLSQQSEATDLLGGLKPISTRSLIVPLMDLFSDLFDDTFSSRRNEKFLSAVSKSFDKQNWKRLILLWQEAVDMSTSLFKQHMELAVNNESQTAKRRKLDGSKRANLKKRWTDFNTRLMVTRTQAEQGDKHHTFAFAEGRLVQSVRNGDWLLLDEINLASADTLDNIAGLLQDDADGRPSLLLTEAGNIEQVQAHPDFRIFAAMNPATDTGKKDLAPGIRSRFTELYVHAGDQDVGDLVAIVNMYLDHLLSSDKKAAIDIANAYLELKNLNDEHQLSDGAGDVPHFSIRSLVRSLLYIIQHSPSHGLRRAIFEGFAMSFFTALNKESEDRAWPLVKKHLLSTIKNHGSFLSQHPKIPADAKRFVSFQHHLVVKGPLEPNMEHHYVRTPSVERNLLNLARAASMQRFPILLQGPTSAGKTSMVEYLAKVSGNVFVRINNHEHTDLQEYLGSYATGNDGKFQFREGVLVQALRQGHWVVLDELNLAPSDVLEALNRLLDDNRELLIPETQELVHPHPDFMLFATQNPAGLYGGRKRLSRAFRNRFLELHFDDIPEVELETILKERTRIAPSFCTHIVKVYKSLTLQRQSSRLFEQQNSFATLRDLFRWASRPADDRQELANHGFMLLAERVREAAERDMVKTIIESVINVKINEDELYGPSVITKSVLNVSGVVWTSAMRRLFVLVETALRNNEPVLLVGGTGCGKTQICQTVTQVFGRKLSIYNAHSNTETGDLIGSQRPTRQRSELATGLLESLTKLPNIKVHKDDINGNDIDVFIAAFENMDVASVDPIIIHDIRQAIISYRSLFTWSDGSLVRSMKAGEHFLLDEISLAEDSVLERLNSVLEPARTILLAEKGDDDKIIVANPTFQFLATMNPGGDYGKRELSAALRNRLTEIWVPPLSKSEDILPILDAKLGEHRILAQRMVDFAVWFTESISNNPAAAVPLRNLLAWASFFRQNAIVLSTDLAFIQGAAMVYLDSLGANPAGLITSATSVNRLRQKCMGKLQLLTDTNVSQAYNAAPQLEFLSSEVKLGPFSLPRNSTSQVPNDFVLEAPTTLKNVLRLFRALQVSRPILLEGDPGVGKTAIVAAVARLVGKPLTRINLSNQTDLMDLFGADAPSHEGKLGRFLWRDGPLLQAMQSGGWVLLDEMNLASQSVLEGLNACLDHRREIYIAELDKSFACHEDFTLFAAQNPHQQGGGRKGLPASFVNRFTVVYADPFTRDDLQLICKTRRPHMQDSALTEVLNTIHVNHELITHSPTYSNGEPWELNLRDANRWLDLVQENEKLPPQHYYDTILTQRFRSESARSSLLRTSVENERPQHKPSLFRALSPSVFQLGTEFLQRKLDVQPSWHHRSLPVSQLSEARSVITAIRHRWPVVLVGSPKSGKTDLIRSIAMLAGAELVSFSMNSDVDTADLIGGFEQYDYHGALNSLQKRISHILLKQIRTLLLDESSRTLVQLVEAYDICQSSALDIDSIQALLQKLSPIIQNFDALEADLQKLRDEFEATGARFVWNDGFLVDALRQGSWLVLDNANLCDASVLDRLNSLLEPNGHLVVTEQHNGEGEERVVTPHPDFRIFLTMDPQFGELSRAMRNRSLEIFLEDVDYHAEHSYLPSYPTSAQATTLRPIIDLVLRDDQSEIWKCLIPYIESLPIAALSPLLLAIPNLCCNRNSQKVLTQIIRDCFHNDEAQHVASEFYRKVSESFPNYAMLEFHYQPQLPLINDPLSELLDVNKPLGTTRTIQMMNQIRSLSLQLESAKINSSKSSRDQRSLLEQSSIFHGKSSKPNSLLPAFDILWILIEKGLKRCIVPEDKIVFKLFAEGEALARDLMVLFQERLPDRAIMAAYFQICKDMATNPAIASTALGTAVQQAVALAPAEYSLRFGKSLQRMWLSWKPQTALSAAHLNARLEMESLVAYFDQLAKRLPQPRSELAQLRTRLATCVGEILLYSNPSEATTAFKEAVDEFIVRQKPLDPTESHFQTTFRWLLGMLMVEDCGNDPTEIHTLSLYADANILAMSADAENSTPHKLRQISELRRLRGIPTMRKNVKQMAALIHGLSTLKEAPLRNLHSVSNELQDMASTISQHTPILGRSASASIAVHLVAIVHSLISSHSDLFQGNVKNEIHAANHLRSSCKMPPIALRQDLGEHSYFKEIFDKHLLPTISVLSERDTIQDSHLGIALMHVSMAALTLLVPERLFDPITYPNLISKRHQNRIAQLQTKIEAHMEFGRRERGQQDTAMVRMYRSDLESLGLTPDAEILYRPDVKCFARLQEVYTMVVKNILENQHIQTLLEPGSHKGGNEALHLNIQKVIDQLLNRFETIDRAYDDLVQPVTWLLNCLALGSDLLYEAMSVSTQSARPYLSFGIPLQGGSPRNIAPEPYVPDTLNHNSKDTMTHEMKLLCLQAAMLKSPCLGETAATAAFLTHTDFFYLEWKTRLDKDQANAETNSRYYAYRGGDDISQEEDESEMNSIFPTFDVMSEDTNVVQHGNVGFNARKTALTIAELHRRFLFPATYPQTLSAQLLDEHSLNIAFVSHFHECPPNINHILPAVFLSMQVAESELSGKDTAIGFNIYTDNNSSEARAIYRLTKNIQDRFAEIAEHWPEHAVPRDVLHICDELLSFKINDPIAKLLTKTEKLHEMVGQWQLVASREWSAALLLEALTMQIVHWRKLELSSWSRLLEHERIKVEEDASSWYFIMYEAILHNSISVIEQGGDTESYCRELTKTLDEFMKTVSLGQFIPRLELLELFTTTLELVALTSHGLFPIFQSVHSTLQHYRRYAKSLTERVNIGRAELEKNILEQIQLASWKDTNVASLRDSARRAHHKLFRVIKKYRSLLSQPIENFKATPLIETIGSHSSSNLPMVDVVIHHSEALAICQNRVPSWGSREDRFKNPLGAVNNMRRLFLSEEKGFDIPDHLASFLHDTIATSKELRKQTPQISTEENTSLATHLRERKRRLFGDTVRQLSFMGVRRNLSTAELRKQSSTPLVFSRSPDLVTVTKTLGIEAADDAFHDLLDSMSSVRAAAVEHSEDLTDGEVRRGIGLLEGLLFMAMDQRCQLNAVNKDLICLRELVTKMKNMGMSQLEQVLHQQNFMLSHSNWIWKNVSYLPSMLKVSCQILEHQARHGHFEVSSLVTQLREISGRLEKAQITSQSQPELPVGIVQQETIDEITSVELELKNLHDLLSMWRDQLPQVQYLMEQLLPWTGHAPAEKVDMNATSRINLADYDISLRYVLDQIFVAMQQLATVRAKMPNSYESSKWLETSNRTFSDAIKALHISEIIASAAKLSDSLHTLQSDEFHVGASLLIVFTPVFEQYSLIADQVYQLQQASHLQLVRLAAIFSKSFTALASEGFCRPVDSTSEQEQSGKLESGTGLGEGEGAEDISRDVGDDEDLSEFAQAGEKDQKEDDRMEHSKDAVDMGADDLEGAAGSSDNDTDEEESSRHSDVEDEREIDEETGSVDDLNPSAVDEKLWDGSKKDEEEESQKEMKGDKPIGKSQNDQTAGNDNQSEEYATDQGSETSEAQSADLEDEGEAQAQAEGETVDPYLEQEQALDLPEDMQIDAEEGKEDDISENGLDELSDIEEPIQSDEADALSETDQEERMEGGFDDEKVGSEVDEDDQEGHVEDTELVEGQDSERDSEREKTFETQDTDMQYDLDTAHGAESGTANEKDNNDTTQKEQVQGQNDREQVVQEQATQSGQASETQQDGIQGQGMMERGAGQESEQQNQQDEAFKKLADVFENYYQRKEISAASEDRRRSELDQDVDMADADFAHLDDENDHEDAQALGAAGADQAQELDENKAVEERDVQMPDDVAMPDEHDMNLFDDSQQETIAERFSRLRTQAQPRTETYHRAAQPLPDPRRLAHEDSEVDDGDEETDDETQQVDAAPTKNHGTSTSTTDAASVWAQCSQRTHSLSVLLTEQLRLILSPTMATKLRGDFRTGKRLNIKRIIPYIASGYKRDKIWMRRSIPSKRNYQILIAVDDSKSMSESGADILAFETLAMLCKSLSMLEAGELCIISFGDEEHIRVAHPFSQPFTGAESGPRVFQNFSFMQKGTDVRKLIRETTALFADARIRAGNATSDLWQLQLIVSDGHCDDHDTIRRQVRAAQEQKIMIVFVIVDAGPDSIVDLPRAVYEPKDPLDPKSEMTVKLKRYLEDFPFRYYVVVRQVEDLPGVLARVLKGWFENVANV